MSALFSSAYSAPCGSATHAQYHVRLCRLAIASGGCVGDPWRSARGAAGSDRRARVTRHVVCVTCGTGPYSPVGGDARGEAACCVTTLCHRVSCRKVSRPRSERRSEQSPPSSQPKPLASSAPVAGTGPGGTISFEQFKAALWSRIRSRCRSE